jgi:UrcA family protein
MSHLNRVIYAAALVLFMSAASTAGHAESLAPGQHSLSINFADLSLDRPGDVKILYRRLAAAADKICGPRVLTGSNLVLPSYEHCYVTAIGNAVTSVANPALTTYYQSLPAYSRVASAELARR